MAIEKVFAQLACADLEKSLAWFGTLFGRAPDVLPMDGLAEWHHGEDAGFQLFEHGANAGRGTLTLIVGALDGEVRRLTDEGLRVPEVETADTVRIVRLADPDGNLVVLAEYGGA